MFQIPQTDPPAGISLAVVKSKFDTGFPSTATTFEVVVVHR